MPPPKMFKPGGPTHTSGIFADMSIDGPVIGDLVVVVDRARNLPNRKTMGKQDPYCAARLGKEAKKTETDKRGGQTPKWDQELRFVVHDGPDYLKLKMSVFNEDRRTDLIGETWIDLQDVIVRGGGQRDGWHRLSCKGKPTGEVRMEITYYDTREKPIEAPKPKASRRPAQVNDSSRDPPTRRPLPRGPGGVEPSARAPVPHSASTSQIPSRHPHPEAALPRHMSTDATEHGPVDPYEHRQKMLATYGLPFDPHVKKDDERHLHHGGPRPVPGQNFSDLDRLRYRNRGVTIPEGLVKDERQQRPRRNTYEPPIVPESDPEPEPESLHFQDEPPLHGIHPTQNYQQQPEPTYPDQDSFDPELYQQHESQPYDIYDHATHIEADHVGYQQPYIEEEEDEGPPPPPPIHRSNVASSSPMPAPPAQREREPLPLSLQHGLARLNAQNGDDFNLPTENSTQLTTHSDMPAPGHSDVYNHGHRPLPRTSHGQGYSPGHQRSMQDMRSSHYDDRYTQHSTPPRQDQSVKRLSYTPHADMQEDFRSSGPYSGQMQVHRQSGYESFGHGEQHNTRASPHHTQHTHTDSGYHPSTVDQFHDRQTHASGPPMVKPRPVSPNINSPHYQPPSAQPSTPQHTSNHASSSNPNSIPRKSIEPGLSGIAFSPDSFDVLNPQVKSARPSTGDPDSMIQSPYANGTGSTTKAHDPSEPIRNSQGRLVDPSDHLPSSTWAPEPEPKKPLKAEVKLRFKGAVPMPATTPRAARPDVQMPAIRSSVFSPHLTEKPGDAGDGKSGERNRLKKKVRVMMTTGGRKERERERRKAEREREEAEREAQTPVTGTSQPLRDIPNVNYGSMSGDAPPLPAKIPLDMVGYEENMGADHLSREMSSIDLGTYSGRSDRRARFATTII